MVQIQPSSGAVEYVGNMTLTCLVEGGSRRVYQWLKNGRPIHTSSTNSFSLQNSSLHIAPVTKEDIGNYSCLVKNPVSKMESDIIMPTIYCKFLKMYIYLYTPGEGNGTPLQYSCLENSMDRGASQATVNRVAKSQT